MTNAEQHLAIFIRTVLHKWSLICEEGKCELKAERAKQIDVVIETLYEPTKKQYNVLSIELDRFYTELIAIFPEPFNRFKLFSTNRRIAYQFAFRSFIAQFNGFPDNPLKPSTNLEACLMFMNTYSIPVTVLIWAIEYWRAVFHKLKALEESELQAEGSLRRFLVYDNGGETLDRYTIFKRPVTFNGMCEYLGTCETGISFSQFGQAVPGRHLGKIVSFTGLNYTLKMHVKKRFSGSQ